MSRSFQRTAPLLPALLMLGCAAKPSDDRQPEAKSTPSVAAQTAAKPEPKPDIKSAIKPEPKPEPKPAIKPERTPEPAVLAAGTAAAPPMALTQVRALSVLAGKLTIEVIIDDPVLGIKALAGPHRKFKGTDGVVKKADPTARGIPEGFREGDSWVVVTEKGAELVTVTGLGFPLGDGPKAAWLVLRDEPKEDTIGIAWPGSELPAGLTMTAAPPATAPDDATFQRVVAAIEPTTPPPRHAPKPEFMQVTPGRFPHGHTHLAVLSPPSLWASERDVFPPTRHTAWTLGPADGPSPALARVFVSAYDAPLVLTHLIDWNGDGIQDAALFNQHEEDDNSDHSTLAVWPDEGPGARMLVSYYF